MGPTGQVSLVFVAKVDAVSHCGAEPSLEGPAGTRLPSGTATPVLAAAHPEDLIGQPQGRRSIAVGAL